MLPLESLTDPLQCVSLERTNVRFQIRLLYGGGNCPGLTKETFVIICYLAFIIGTATN